MQYPTVQNWMYTFGILNESKYLYINVEQVSNEWKRK